MKTCPECLDVLLYCKCQIEYFEKENKKKVRYSTVKSDILISDNIYYVS